MDDGMTEHLVISSVFSKVRVTVDGNLDISWLKLLKLPQIKRCIGHWAHPEYMQLPDGKGNLQAQNMKVTTARMSRRRMRTS